MMLVTGLHFSQANPGSFDFLIYVPDRFGAGSPGGAIAHASHVSYWRDRNEFKQP